LGGTGHLFPEKDRSGILKRFRAALHLLNPMYELRSPRRGALTAMAERGATADTLMSFSGHTNQRMLLRYLGWGCTSRPLVWRRRRRFGRGVGSPPLEA
jgi:hypothetical protein